MVVGSVRASPQPLELLDHVGLQHQEGGEKTVGYRRERPYVLQDPKTGDPLFLFNGLDLGNGTHPFVVVQKVGPD